VNTWVLLGCLESFRISCKSSRTMERLRIFVLGNLLPSRIGWCRTIEKAPSGGSFLVPSVARSVHLLLRCCVPAGCGEEYQQL
jgi:hypothetical protein